MRYTRAPVVEAVIDLQAAFASPPSLEDVQRVSDAVALEFPEAQTIHSFAVNLSPEAGQSMPAAPVSSKLGFKRTSVNNDRILQLRMQGFAYSHLPPYTSWDQFTGEMWPLWRQYCDRLHVESVGRIGVRFINRLAIPVLVDTDDYLLLSPKIPASASSVVIGYFMQTVFPLPALGESFRAVLNTGVEPARPGDAANLLLDIDVFGEGRFSAIEAELKHQLNNLRAEKNRLFEACITDKYRESIA